MAINMPGNENCSDSVYWDVSEGPSHRPRATMSYWDANEKCYIKWKAIESTREGFSSPDNMVNVIS